MSENDGALLIAAAYPLGGPSERSATSAVGTLSRVSVSYGAQERVAISNFRLFLLLVYVLSTKEESHRRLALQNLARPITHLGTIRS